MTEPEFEALLLEAIDEALFVLGDSVTQTVYFHLERSFNIKKDEIPYRLGTFTQAIENIFGAGAKFIEILIMKKLHKKVEGVLKWNESERFGFTEYVARAKRLFNARLERTVLHSTFVASSQRESALIGCNDYRARAQDSKSCRLCTQRKRN